MIKSVLKTIQAEVDRVAATLWCVSDAEASWLLRWALISTIGHNSYRRCVVYGREILFSGNKVALDRGRAAVTSWVSNRRRATRGYSCQARSTPRGTYLPPKRRDCPKPPNRNIRGTLWLFSLTPSSGRKLSSRSCNIFPRGKRPDDGRPNISHAPNGMKRGDAAHSGSSR